MILKDQLVFNSPGMSCCGKPRGECTCNDGGEPLAKQVNNAERRLVPNSQCCSHPDVLCPKCKALQARNQDPLGRFPVTDTSVPDDDDEEDEDVENGWPKTVLEGLEEISDVVTRFPTTTHNLNSKGTAMVTNSTVTNVWSDEAREAAAAARAKTLSAASKSDKHGGGGDELAAKAWSHSMKTKDESPSKAAGFHKDAADAHEAAGEHHSSLGQKAAAKAHFEAADAHRDARAMLVRNTHGSV